MRIQEDQLSNLVKLSDQLVVSIIAPTHRTSPDNQADRVLVKNLFAQALRELEEQGKNAQTEAIRAKLEAAENSIDWGNTLDGLAIYITASFVQKFDLTHRPVARTSVSDQVVVADLVRDSFNNFEFNLLVLSESPTRLFTGTSDSLVENREGFPLSHEGQGGALGKPTGFGKQTSVIMDEEHRKFFRSVEAALSAEISKQARPLPLFISGVDRYLAFWQEVAPSTKPTGTITGSFDFMTAAQLGDAIAPALLEHSRELQDQVLNELDNARSEKRYAAGSEIQDLAAAGRIKTLVLSDDQVASNQAEKAIQQTLLAGGEVRFVAADALADYSELAAILRF